MALYIGMLLENCVGVGGVNAWRLVRDSLPICSQAQTAARSIKRYDEKEQLAATSSYQVRLLRAHNAHAETVETVMAVMSHPTVRQVRHE